MKVLIDANILLDVFQKRSPHYEKSALIWKLCEVRKITGYISVLTVMNMVYIMRKEFSSEMINNVYKALALIFNFEDLTEDDVKNALEMQLKDFEDAVQIQTARRIGASIIITRNVKDFLKSPIPAYTPEEFLNRIDTEQS